MFEAADLVAGQRFFFLQPQFADHPLGGASEVFVLQQLKKQVIPAVAEFDSCLQQEVPSS